MKLPKYHFDIYPLHTQKRTDYELFKQVVLMLLNKKHFTGLLKIIAIKAAMNKGLSESLKTVKKNKIQNKIIK